MCSSLIVFYSDTWTFDIHLVTITRLWDHMYVHVYQPPASLPPSLPPRPQHGHTPLHLATLSGHKDFASSLIDDGACVNLTNGEGCTALMLAAMDDRIGLVELFTLSNADPGVMDNASCKAVDHARTRNHQT